jgi:hypothetical protein
MLPRPSSNTYVNGNVGWMSVFIDMNQLDFVINGQVLITPKINVNY